MTQLNSIELTYLNGRKCKHCSTKIADQDHASTEFCPRIEYPDHTIKSCKDDYYAALNKTKNQPYVNIANFYKLMDKKIKELFNQQGELVTLDQLDQYGIRIDRAAQTDRVTATTIVCHFAKYTLTQVNQSQFKISNHEKFQ